MHSRIMLLNISKKKTNIKTKVQRATSISYYTCNGGHHQLRSAMCNVHVNDGLFNAYRPIYMYNGLACTKVINIYKATN